MGNVKLIPRAYSSGGSVNLSLQPYIEFINKLEGWKTRCKNLHWAATAMNIHKQLDDFLEILSDYEDTLAEGIMGALNVQIPAGSIKGTPCDITDALSFIRDVKSNTLEFYSKLSDKPLLCGVKSECETFIQNINKFDYLFSLC